MGADDERELAARQRPERLAAPRRRRRPGEQRERDRLAGEQRVEGCGVLLGERLGRRHQRRLVARLERPQHREHGDDRLARPDLAHQQPLHRPAAGEVGVDLLERRPLGRGRLERQRRDPALAERPLGPQRDPRPAFATGGCGASRAPPGGGRAPRTRAAPGPARPPAATRGSGRCAARRPRPAGRAGPAARRAVARRRRRRSRPPARPNRAAAPPRAGRSRCGPGRSRSCGCRRRSPPATISWVATRNPERSSLPLRSSVVPGVRRSAR